MQKFVYEKNGRVKFMVKMVVFPMNISTCKLFLLNSPLGDNMHCMRVNL